MCWFPVGRKLSFLLHIAACHVTSCGHSYSRWQSQEVCGPHGPTLCVAPWAAPSYRGLLDGLVLRYSTLLTSWACHLSGCLWHLFCLIVVDSCWITSTLSSPSEKFATGYLWSKGSPCKPCLYPGCCVFAIHVKELNHVTPHLHATPHLQAGGLDVQQVKPLPLLADPSCTHTVVGVRLDLTAFKNSDTSDIMSPTIAGNCFVTNLYGQLQCSQMVDVQLQQQGLLSRALPVDGCSIFCVALPAILLAVQHITDLLSRNPSRNETRDLLYKQCLLVVIASL